MAAHTYTVRFELPTKRVRTEEDERKSQAYFDKMRRKSRRFRRRLIRDGSLLTGDEFCSLRGISRHELRRLERQRNVFGVDVDHRRYYPRELATQPRVLLSRLTRVCRRLRKWVPGWSRYDVVVTGRWETLGGKTMVQAVHRPNAFRRALVIAHGHSEERAPR